jgi:hypothetical protein
MTEPPASPVPYRVAYSELARREVRNLIARAQSRGLGSEVIAAVREMDARLRIYPQFGDPLRDLELKPAQLWIGCVPPLVVRYWLDDQTRTVIVFSAIVPLPRSGLEP